MYDLKEVLEDKPMPSAQQSIFTSAYFKQWETLNANANTFRGVWKKSLYTKTLGSFVLHTLNVASLLHPIYTGIDTHLYTNETNDEVMSFPLDPINFALAKAAWYAISYDPVHWFPSLELIEALKRTRLEWLDLSTFKALPDVFTIKLPKRFMHKMFVDNTWHSLDDIMFMRATHKEIKKHLCRTHKKDYTEDMECWQWIFQSRDELSDMYQLTQYGSFVVDQHAKLQDVLMGLETWVYDQTAEVAKEAPEMLEHLDKLKKQGITEDTSDYLLEAVRFTRDAIESAAGKNIDLHLEILKALEMCFKFIMIQQTDACVVTPIIPSGIDLKKTSKKAKEIQAKIMYRYGNRQHITIKDESIYREDSDRNGPVRHWVQGFFRRQHHGPQNALVKVIFVAPFWRGSDHIGS